MSDRVLHPLEIRAVNYLRMLALVHKRFVRCNQSNPLRDEGAFAALSAAAERIEAGRHDVPEYDEPPKEEDVEASLDALEEKGHK